MKKKSFIFLIIAILLFIVVVVYAYLYSKDSGKGIVNTLVDSTKGEKQKPTIRELEKAAEEVIDKTPLTPARITELEKAAEAVSVLPDNSNIKNAADQMAAFDKEREKNREALTKAAQGVSN